jgi:subtilisin family serine protease
MRASDKRLIISLSVSGAIAVAALAAATSATQAQRMGHFSMGQRGGSMMGGGGIRMQPSFRGEPRFQRFNTNKIVGGDAMKGRGQGTPKGKGRGKSSDVSTNEPARGDGRPGRRPPRRPLGHGPNIGVVVGPGVAIGTGVAIGPRGPSGPGGAGPLPPSGGGAPAPRNAINSPAGGENRFVKDEVLLEFAGNFPRPGILQLLARHRLSLLESQSFTLTNSTIVRAHIDNRRPVRAVLQRLGNEVTLRAGQPNYLYQAAQGQSAAQSGPLKPTPVMATAAAIAVGGDPAQYALTKLRIGEAHTLAKGDTMVVAVIDSGIDLGHPELAGVVVGSFDALGKIEKPHQHGTAIAGAIAAHSRLLGAAPAAKILAIRAFGASGTSAEATTMAILKSVEYASVRQARIINMSFAGPADPALSRELAAAKAKGAVLIAATGNFGPKSPPQYPAADPNVIAVSATDADDRMFGASNIGPHVAVAAPGVDILLPSPGNDYRLISGTSFSAAYVSGVAALVLQRAPGLTPDGVRKILEQTAKDLGPVGRDPEFGAGLVDAYQAIMAVQPPSAAAAAQDTPAPKEAEAR